MKKIIEKIVENIFLICAFVAIICICIITLFIFSEGLPAISKVGFLNFVFGKKWIPDGEIFGIFPMIVASIYTTVGAIVIGVPVGILAAIFINYYASKKVSDLLIAAIQLLAGIPSVVFGFFGLVVIVPIIDQLFGGKGSGSSLLAASIILGIMILPTIVTTSKTALSAVPREYREGSLALGASKEQTIFHVLLPAASSGVFAGIVLGIGRAVGETMAVILVAGNSAIIPKSLTDPVRTMTANIAIEMGYAYGLHQQALFATGIVLFLFIMILNITLSGIQQKAGDK